MLNYEFRASPEIEPRRPEHRMPPSSVCCGAVVPPGIATSSESAKVISHPESWAIRPSMLIGGRDARGHNSSLPQTINASIPAKGALRRTCHLRHFSLCTFSDSVGVTRNARGGNRRAQPIRVTVRTGQNTGRRRPIGAVTALSPLI